MKIEKIETWLVSKWLTVRVTCDDGTYGVGEGNFWSYADATEVIATFAYRTKYPLLSFAFCTPAVIQRCVLVVFSPRIGALIATHTAM